MAGPFVNQKLSSLPVFDATRDQGRMVWLTEGTIWYGSDIEWVNFASGSGDATEVEDLYSDLLRTTIFMNASYDGFIDTDNNLVDSTTMTYVRKRKIYSYTSGQVITSINMFDITSGIDYVDYVLVYVNYVGTGSVTIEVSSNGGAYWNIVSNNRVFRIPDAYIGNDLRLRFTSTGEGELLSWGVLYNKDLTASCTKYGLTYRKFISNYNQTVFEIDYYPGAIQVFLNGELVDDTDIIATSGVDVVFVQPLQDGDIVYIISYSTSILGPNFDPSDYIRHDGGVIFTNEQSMGNNKLIDVANGAINTDAINLGQLNTALSGKVTSVVAGTNVSVDNITDPKNPVVSVTGNIVTGISAGTNVSVDNNTNPKNPVVSVTGNLVNSVVAGDNVSVDVTNSKNPTVSVPGNIVSSIGAGDNISVSIADLKNPVVSIIDVVTSVVAGTNVSVDNITDPKNPVVSVVGVTPVGSIVAFIGGYFGSNSNASFASVLGNSVADVNTLLNSTGWYVCDGSELNLTSSPIFNAAGRYLPKLTDNRFLMGDADAGVTGGNNSSLHTHTTGDHTLSIDEMPSHRHSTHASATKDQEDYQLQYASNDYHWSSDTLAENDNDYGGATGGGLPHNHGVTGNNSLSENRPQFLSCLYIMRVV